MYNQHASVYVRFVCLFLGAVRVAPVVRACPVLLRHELTHFSFNALLEDQIRRCLLIYEFLLLH